MGGKLIADGKALRKLRHDAWLNRRDLAKIAGCSEHTIMRIELGYTPHPTRTTVKKLAKALEVHPSAIARIEEDEEDDSNNNGSSSYLGGLDGLGFCTG